MPRRAKPAKAEVEARRPVARKSPKNEASKRRELEKRLAESLERERAKDRALVEALEQQTATAEILRVISTSPTDLQPVLDAVVRSAARFCGADDAELFRLDGEYLAVAAHHGPIPAPVGRLIPVVQGSVSGRAFAERRAIHVADLQAEAEEFPVTSGMARELGFRASLSVPLLREGMAVGTITLRRAEVNPFTDKQIKLLETFADQAVIAIENVRLFEELEGRNRDLTATSEILRVIASSPTELQPVFDTIAERSMRLCEATSGWVMTFDGELLHVRSLANVSPEVADALRREFPRAPSRGIVAGRSILTGLVTHVPDVMSDPEYGFKDAPHVEHFRSALTVPLLHHGRAIGAIVVARPEPKAFSEEQIQLLKTFADQAVIAVENVRLFKELQEKNEALTQAHAQVSEALEQQTATAEILRVISRSQTDVQPVFDAIVRNAVQLCDAVFGRVFRRDGEMILLAANANFPDELGHHPAPLNQDTLAGRVMVSGRLHLSVDVETDPAIPVLARETYRHRGVRSILSVPMLRDGQAIGAIAVGHRDEGAFADTHVALLQTFADQAVIAIENARLLSELQARTRELTQSVDTLTALGEVGQAISSTLDLQTVLRTIVTRATQLADADAGVIYEYDEQREVFEPRATERLEDDIVQTLVATPVRKGQGATGRLAEVREPIQLADLRALGEQIPVRDILIRAGYRALLAVPLVRENHLIGGLTVFRKTPGEFAAEIVDLLKTFATQSSLAIQNARLFREIADKSAQLEAASRHKSEFLANMSHELRTPLNAIIGFSEVLTERMFGELNDKQTEYLQDILESGRHLLSLINDILDLSKIEAGRMELELSDFHLPTSIENALILVRERATRRGITLGHSVDERLGTIQGDERKVKQVLLNLLSNALKFTSEGGRIEVSAGVHDEVAEIAVADTGVGIAPEDQEAVFDEFRQVGTAEKKVEGTGLGLALSRKFIELHGGRIWVKSELGTGSTFTFTLPVRRGE